MSSILISTGEASGDAVGAELVRELRRLGHEGPVSAIGGPRLRDAGADVVVDSTEWGAIGILQSLMVAPRIKLQSRSIMRQVRDDPPALLIPIDFGYFNVRLAKLAKQGGGKVLYFMPPGSWRKTIQGSNLADITDLIATPFEWSARLLSNSGCEAVWVGHPALQMAASVPEAARTLFGLLPGSRKHEVALNLPLMASVVGRLATGGLEPTIVAAPSLSDSAIARYWPANVPRPRIWRDGALSALKRSRAAIVCSGTATLESAVCDVPIVVIYEFARFINALQWWIANRDIPYIAMPSILLDEAVVPELLGHAPPDAVALEVQRLLADSPERKAQLNAFNRVRAALGPTDAITRTAHLALDLLRR